MRLWHRNPTFLSNSKDAGKTRMRILHIVHGIFGRLLFRQVQIKIKMAIGPAHQEEKFGCIGAHFIHHLSHGDELAGALRHLNFLAAT